VGKQGGGSYYILAAGGHVDPDLIGVVIEEEIHG